jgi:hypothetical protein
MLIFFATSIGISVFWQMGGTKILEVQFLHAPAHVW